MTDLERAQAAIDAISAVCRKHGVMLVGSCVSEGIVGEIAIFDAEQCRRFGDENVATESEVSNALAQVERIG